MSYRLYYSDGTHVDCEGDTGLPSGVPTRDVQVIVQKVEESWRATNGHDFYVWRDGEWIGVDLFGLFDYLVDSGLVLFGRTLPNAQFRMVMRAALAERERRDTHG